MFETTTVCVLVNGLGINVKKLVSLRATPSGFDGLSDFTLTTRNFRYTNFSSDRLSRSLGTALTHPLCWRTCYYLKYTLQKEIYRLI